MTETLTHHTSRKIDLIVRDYALRDAKGREIGGRFYISEVTYYPKPAEATWGSYHPVGTVITGCPQATRGGQTYGASQHAKEYPTVEDARAAAEIYFTKAAKRAGHR
jgi:hypothetical protein